MKFTLGRINGSDPFISGRRREKCVASTRIFIVDQCLENDNFDIKDVLSLKLNLLRNVSSETKVPLKLISQSFRMNFPYVLNEPLKSYPIASDIDEGLPSSIFATSTFDIEWLLSS